MQDNHHGIMAAGPAACPQAKHCHAARRPSCLPAGEALPRGPQAKLLARRRSTATRPAGQAACPQAKHCHAARRPSCLPAGEALPRGPHAQHPDTVYHIQYHIYIYIILYQKHNDDWPGLVRPRESPGNRTPRAHLRTLSRKKPII